MFADVGQRSTRARATEYETEYDYEHEYGYVGPMPQPPGPVKLFPGTDLPLIEEQEEGDELELQYILELQAAKYAEGNPYFEPPESVIEPPPEWSRPDEGNPNQPRRPREYTPPQVILVIVGTVVSTNMICVLCSASLIRSHMPTSPGDEVA